MAASTATAEARREVGHARGDVLYTCSGVNEHAKRCGKILLAFVRPADLTRNGSTPDLGKIEVVCPRCRTTNYIRLGDSLPHA